MRRLSRFGAGLLLGLGAFATLGGGAVTALLAFSGTAHASPTCGTMWKTATSGDWSMASNWNNGVPTSSTNACITVAGNYTVTITATAAVANTLTLGASSGDDHSDAFDCR
jgi:hypothetical protein